MSREPRHRAGHRAERAACWLLRLKGWRILARRLRTPVAEVDILARRGATVAVVEVKRRSDGLADAAVGPAQRQRLARAARLLAGSRPELAACSWRIDLVLVAPWGLPRHIADAWPIEAER